MFEPHPLCLSTVCPCARSTLQGRLEGHQHYVQGVAWDPLGHMLLTLSNDRTAKVLWRGGSDTGEKPL